MAKDKDANMYRPIKNADLIGKGEKKTVPQIIADGKKSKPETMGHVEFENQKKVEAEKRKRPRIDLKVQEAKNNQAQISNDNKKQKPKEKEHDKDH